MRRLWGKPLIGVTGSAGKTTTKEIIAHVLATRHCVLKSQGNLNNHFGLPLQLLKLEPEHEIAVIEMGMSHAGEITALARLAQPNCGVVTMVAPVHLEFFDSIADIARAKYELIESLPAGGIAVLNADDAYVSQFGRDFHGKVVTFGLHKPADVAARNIEALRPVGSAFDIVSNGESVRATLPLLGEHSIYNALAGVAVGLQYGVTLARTPPNRWRRFPQVTSAGRCWNTREQPSSTIATIPIRRRWTAWCDRWRRCRRSAASWWPARCSNWDRAARPCTATAAGTWEATEWTSCSACAGWRSFIVEGAAAANVAAEFVATPEEAGEWLKRNVKTGDLVLLKASRGVRLERALEVWMGRTADGSH